MGIEEIEQRLLNLEKAFMQSQSNRIENDEILGAATNQLKNNTPNTESKKAYIGDTSCIFNGVREGNVTAYMVTDSGLAMPTTIVRSGDSVVVAFDELNEVATVTISVL